MDYMILNIIQNFSEIKEVIVMYGINENKIQKCLQNAYKMTFFNFFKNNKINIYLNFLLKFKIKFTYEICVGSPYHRRLKK